MLKSVKHNQYTHWRQEKMMRVINCCVEIVESELHLRLLNDMFPLSDRNS